MEPQDPVLLLKSIREAQDMLMALNKDRTPETGDTGCVYVCRVSCSPALDWASLARQMPHPSVQAYAAEIHLFNGFTVLVLQITYYVSDTGAYSLSSLRFVANGKLRSVRLVSPCQC